MSMRRKSFLTKGIVLFIVFFSVFSFADANALELGDLSNRIAVLYSSQNGLPSSEANTICQTENGYIWIGSYAGLIRYDGKRFQNLSESENLPAGIRILFESSDGTLWIGTNDEGIYSYKNDVFTQCVLSDGTPLPSVRCIAQTPDNTLYVGTTGGIYFSQNGVFFQASDPVMQQAVDCLAVDQNGTLWGCGSAASIFAWQDGKVVGYWKPHELIDENYKSLATDGERVYIGTFSNKILAIEIKDNKYTEDSFVIYTLSTGPLSTVNSIFRSVDGKLWIGADNGTGYINDSNEIITNEELIACTGVSQIIQDYENNLWIASSKKGIYQISEGRFYHDLATGGMSINATAVTDRGTFIATDTGLRIVNKHWQEIQIPGLELLRDIRIRDVMVDSKGLVWICTYSDLGLFCYDTQKGQVQVYTDADGLLNSWTRKAVELSDGRVAILTYHGLNFIKNGIVLSEHFGSEEGIKALPILCLTETPDQTLYAGTDGDGLYSIRNGELKKEKDGCLDGLSVVLAMARDPENGGVWFSSGNDMFFVDAQGSPRKLPKFTTGVGSVFDIVFSGEDVIFTKSEGIYIVNRERMLNDEEVTSVSYSLKDGLRGNMNANSRSVLYEDCLFLTSSEGLNLFPLSGQYESATAPKVYINNIVIQKENGEETFSYIPVDGEQTIRIPNDTRRLMIRFACLSFAGRACKIEYALSGFDTVLTEVYSSDESTATYTNLPGGKYTFTLKAVNSAGMESELPVRLVIDKELTFWEHTWVKILTIATGVLLFLLIFWLKFRQVKKDQERYRAITHQSLETMANTIDAKDSYTKGHSMRVATYSRELARRLNLSKREQEEIYFIALLHDIGKIGTPDAILNKPGKLTNEEFDIIRKHTVDGAGILSKFTILPHIWKGARWHHERIDGMGYPDGLKGNDIPYLARIICVADAFDAMATNRPYRNAMDMEKIVQELQDCKNTQFEAEIVDHMVEYIREEEEKLSGS